MQFSVLQLDTSQTLFTAIGHAINKITHSLQGTIFAENAKSWKAVCV